MRVRIYDLTGATLGYAELAPGLSPRDLARRQRAGQLFFDDAADTTEPLPAAGEAARPPARKPAKAAV